LCESAGIRQASVAALWQAYCGGAPGIYWTRIWSMFALLHWTKVNRAEL
jgi:asparagine synthase (glutamine-hydrolysing)